MTPGQDQAVEELSRIVAAIPGTVVVGSIEEVGGNLVAVVGLDCRGFEHAEGGVRVRQREWFDITVPPRFPFKPPRADVRHTRWEHVPHVQWRRHLCLYVAPGVEWNAADGMYGFFGRLDQWIRQAALGQLDPVAGPQHPPVAYPTTGTPLFIPRADTPDFDGPWWAGFGELTSLAEYRHDIVGWHAVGTLPPGDHAVAATVLLKERLPFEFPEKLGDLIGELERAKFTKDLLYLLLGVAAYRINEGAPLYVIVGTPMRSTSSGEPRQHLAIWRLDADAVGWLKTLLIDAGDNERIRELLAGLEEAVDEWTKVAPVAWCKVREARPEVTNDRTGDSPLAAFAGLKVALWGCGAIGSHVAELLVRAGVSHLVLRDDGIVAPGVLGRQRFDDNDIGDTKAGALKRHLERIRPGVLIDAHYCDVINNANVAADWSDGAALVIDATASNGVGRYLEYLRMRWPRSTHIASLVFGHTAEHGLMTFCPASTAVGPAGASRHAKLAALRDPNLASFADEFWPDPPRTAQFQPEPGCSEPTFTGSGADVSALTARMLRQVAAELDAAIDRAMAFFTALGRTSPAPRDARVFVRPEVVLHDPFAGYDVRLGAAATAEIRAWVRRVERLAPSDETGGILFGERDDALRVFWVTDVLGPPPDSHASPAGFVCGVDGVDEAAEWFQRRSRGSSRPIGMWHTHPDGQPCPSPTDRDGMRQLVDDADRTLPKQLLLIVGGSDGDHRVAAYTYESGKAPPDAYSVASHVLPGPERPAHRIGLALSGGGFRAVAYHLGVLRALHDRGVLEHVDVVSSVSGGSIIAAMWAYADEPFDVFDRRVVDLLEGGLAMRITRRAIFSVRAPQSAAATVVAGIGKVTVSGLSHIANLFRLVVRRPRKPAPKPPFRRFVNRTTAVQDVLEAELFGTTRMSETRRDLAVVINACELRGGNAFRFGSAESGSSRFGRLTANDVHVARAVAASAAYPVAFPATDTIESFTAFDGTEHAERVLLTDGGVYDNLGITALEPGRSSRYSTNVHPVDYIVSADAGQGVLDVDKWPLWWFARMKRSFESVYRKVQDGGKSLLHEQRASGALRGFALPLLGMHDTALPLRPPDLVPRDAVVGYPTNLSAMTDENLALLTTRGEQLTRLVIDLHCPEIA